ncbi:MAG: hypothetical protein E6R11_00695 [Rhodocyclaceae bacterium]|nr:MAG: hypothetical protein E6R11_00695 [Rhodocyclaceae bacterium]
MRAAQAYSRVKFALHENAMWKDFWFAGATRNYWVLSSLLMLGYVLAITLGVQLDSGWPMSIRVLAALVPALLIIGFVVLEFRRIRNTDELRQRMELEAGMLTLAVSVPLLSAIGLLDDAGIMEVPFLMSVPALMLIYIAAQAWAHRRYQ